MSRHEFAASRRTFLGLLAISPWLGACVGSPVLRQAGLQPVAPEGLPQEIPAPTLRVGDQWQYRKRDGLTGLTTNESTIRIASVVPDGYAVAEAWQDGGAVEAQYDRSLNPLRTQNLVFDPPFPRYSFPLALGKAWGGEILMRVVPTQRYGTVRQRVRANVRDWERVSVPAGTFTAMRIDISTDSNDTDAASLSGTTAESIWYVPQVRNMVFYHRVDFHYRQETNNSVLELVSFRLGA